MMIMLIIIMTIMIFFAEKRHQICPQERKITPKGAPGFAERENPGPESRAGENGGQGTRPPATPTTASPDGVLRTAATNEQKNRTHLYTAETKRRGGATAGFFKKKKSSIFH